MGKEIKIEEPSLKAIGHDRKPQATLVGIQILRGIAASIVALHHSMEEALFSNALPKTPAWLTTFGASGVDIFFVISGFIMLYTSYPIEQQPLTPLRFAKKRASRIYPLYWACVLLTLILWSAGFFRTFQPTYWSVIRASLLLPTDKPVITVAWTLVYEIYFYTIFALALFFGSRLKSTVAATIVVLSMLYLSQFIQDPTLNKFLADPIVLEFSFGMFLAYAFFSAEIPDLVLRYGATMGFAALCLASVIVPHASTNGLPETSRWFAWGLPAVIVVAAFSGLNEWSSRFQCWAVLVGDASYAIYLTHPFVMISYATILRKLPTLAGISQIPIIPFVFAVCICVGVFTHLFLEKPLVELVRYTFRKS